MHDGQFGLLGLMYMREPFGHRPLSRLVKWRIMDWTYRLAIYTDNYWL